MKGIILAGGLGTRLYPLTKATNKHLLPIYDKPMIFYPIQTLTGAGIKDIMIVTSGPHSGHFISILKNGEDFGCRFYYGYQDKPDGGIADALSICRTFAGDDNMCVILGDNTTDANISKQVNDFDEREPEYNDSFIYKPYSHLFLKKVPTVDAKRFGIATVKGNLVTEIKEKPQKPKTNLAVTGLYLYDSSVWEFIDQCEPSKRGELEITDVNNMFIKNGQVTYSMLQGFWKDAGTPDSMLEASNYWACRHAK